MQKLLVAVCICSLVCSSWTWAEDEITLVPSTTDAVVAVEISADTTPVAELNESAEIPVDTSTSLVTDESVVLSSDALQAHEEAAIIEPEVPLEQAASSEQEPSPQEDTHIIINESTDDTILPIADDLEHSDPITIPTIEENPDEVIVSDTDTRTIRRDGSMINVIRK